jgi:Domain of unknown function (DUF1707)
VASGYDMRVGDAERDAAANELREHFASGRLTQDELNERLDRALGAKTRGDLSGLFSDLPSSTAWQEASADGANALAGGPFGANFGPKPWGANRSLGRPGEQWVDWGAGYGGRSGSGTDDPFGGGGRSGGSGRRTAGMVLAPLMLLAVLGLGIYSIFGLGGPRPFGFILILAAFALLRRLVFILLGRRRGGRGGSRRGGRGGPRGRRR